MDAVKWKHGWQKFLNTCGQMDTRLTKILEQIRTKGWTAEEKLWMAGCMMCQVFLEQIHGVSEGHIQCLFFAITEVIRILVRENDEQNCAFLNWLIRYDTVFEFSVPWHDSILWSWIIIQVPGVGGGGLLDISLGGKVRRGPSYPDPV